MESCEYVHRRESGYLLDDEKTPPTPTEGGLMPYPDQLTEMRNFIRDDALQFLVVEITIGEGGPRWHCKICGLESPNETVSRARAKHHTYCRLKNILGVVE